MSPRAEFDLIARIRNRNLTAKASVRTGIGDDCAVLAPSGENEVTVTTDMLVEGVDFERTWMPAAFLGWKSLAVSVSDLAAMGAEPTGCLLALALPPELTDSYFDNFMEGFLQGCELWSVPLVGGDISSSPIVSVTVTAFGAVPPGQAIYRRGARPGTFITVIGDLGLSRRGLELLQKEQPLLSEQLSTRDDLERWSGTPGRARAFRAHLLPRPLLSAGIWIRKNGLAESMIDVSDGLLADLQHILQESGVAAEIDAESLEPLQTVVKPSLELEMLLNGGEDYALLLTSTREQLGIMNERHPEDFPRFFTIGRVIQGSPSISLLEGGSKRLLSCKGFEHFR
ncbi:MAG: thiamine-phosphate kinase [Acidobacteria bacterium]|nr:MAG: thiamine-phosphate kinase [Acidobacteriota bacterium]